MGLNDIVLQNLKRDDMMEAMYEYLAEQESKVGFDGMNELEKKVYGIYRLETEINKRGFEQYFKATKGVYSNMTLDFLQEIEAFDIYYLLDNGVKLSKAKMDEEDRMDSYSELDEEYFDLEEEMWEFYGKCINYVKVNI